MTEKSAKVDAGLKEYKEDVFHFYDRAIPTINYCKIDKPATTKTTEPTRSRESSSYMKYNFNSISFMNQTQVYRETATL